MQNSLIPYSFIPGTKAKAQEVNANFIALADKIQDNQSVVTNQLTEIESTFSNKLEQVENTITNQCASPSLANTGTITNTILEAPNGVADYDSQTVNVKAGLKVLIPDGKEANGRLKNVEYVTPDIITKTVTNLKNTKTVLFLNDDGTVDIVYQGNVFYKNTTPTTLTDNVHWYNTDTNKWNKYVKSASEWQEIKCLPIAIVIWNNNSQISSLVPSKAINLVKASDLNDFYTIKGILPKELDYVVERWQSGWSYYEVYKSGWVRQGGYVDGNGDAYANFFIPVSTATGIALARASGPSTTGSSQVWVRSISSYNMAIYSPSATGRIWNVCGYKLNAEEV